MRHQTKRKYADRKNLNRKYHPQKAYRKQQKRKTGWRARWDKFTDRLANIFGIDFLILATAWGQLPAGNAVEKGDPLFPRLDVEKISVDMA